MKTKKITQTSIAAEAGVSSEMICQLLSGKKKAGWKTAKGLARATGLEPILFLEGSLEEIRKAIGLFMKGGGKSEQTES